MLSEVNKNFRYPDKNEQLKPGLQYEAEKLHLSPSHPLLCLCKDSVTECKNLPARVSATARQDIKSLLMGLYPGKFDFGAIKCSHLKVTEGR